jgi:hypothetical protein
MYLDGGVELSLHDLPGLGVLPNICTWMRVLNSLSMICLAWVFWVGICRASAIDCHEKLGVRERVSVTHHSGIRIIMDHFLSF